MKNFNRSTTLMTALLLSAFGATAAMAQDAAAPAAPASAAMSTPAMAGPLSANPNPLGVDLGDDLGKIYITGQVSGMAYYQSSPTKATFGDLSTNYDLTNAQVEIQKTDGFFQFYVQAGEYSFPTVGTSYTKATTATQNSFGVLPEAYVKLQGQGDMADWSVEGGKLPTLTGDEYNFTFQNMNIERGLLWNIEPAVSRGAQVNYSNGPLNFSLSWNDGYYTNLFNTLSGLASYAFTSADTLAVSGSAQLGNPHVSLLASGNLLDVIWTHTSGNWVISPYFQYSTTPSVAVYAPKGTSEIGEAVLVSYGIDDNWKLAGRFEYESSTGHQFAATNQNFNIIGFGDGSNAFEFTLTPTWQLKAFYIRPEVSYISVGDGTKGDLFGKSLSTDNQFRGMIEAGIVF